MTTGEAAVPFPAGSRSRMSLRQPPALKRAVEWLTPRQGWDALLLLMGVVGVAVWTVREAGWVETPGLLPIVVLSTVAGLLLAKVRAPWPLLQPVGLAIGAGVVVWQGSSLAEGETLSDQVREIWSRLTVWYEAATSGGISTDLLPFTLALLTLAWLIGFMGSWFLFRRSNVWVGLILAGLAMLTNLSFLPERFESRFFLFTLLAMILVGRVGTVRRQEQWRQAGTSIVSSSKWISLRAIVGLSLVVLALAALLPLQVYVSKTAVDLWNTGRAPVAHLEDEFARLFGSIAARKDVAGRFFGTTLPFQGKISFDGDIVIWARSEETTYWLSTAYSHYTSQGWIAGETRKQAVGGESLPPPPQESFNRVPVLQSLVSTFATQNLLTGGHLDWVSRDAEAEILKPLEFEIDILSGSPNGELPQDIQVLAAELRRRLNPPPPGFVESYISRMLPADMALVRTVPSSGDLRGTRLRGVVLARKEPGLPEVVSWRFAGRLEADESYVMKSFVSKATASDLRSSGTEYSGFVKDHYLQLPASLPTRVRDLAFRITQGAETPFDKAIAIQEYLRDGTFVYSQDIDKPPRDADGVDHFLFSTKTGYSDYFASAMAVMLRSVGVPARLAAGYAPGEEVDETGRRAVRDSDSHGWVHVYFPGHGWIDFEPTPNWPVLEYRPALATPLDAEPASPSANEGTQGELDDLEAEGCLMEDLGELALDPGMTIYFEECLTGDGTSLEDLLAGLEADGGPPSWLLLLGVLAPTVLGLGFMSWLVWTGGLARGTPAERAYVRMGRLGFLAGLRRRDHHTPIEYARLLGSAIPGISAGALEVAWAFASGRYGGQDAGGPDGDGSREVNAAWKSLRAGLLRRAVRRTVPLGKA